MTSIWGSGDWKVNGATVTSPNNNTEGAINEEWATGAPIAPDAITTLTFKVSGAAIQTAFNVGIGELGASVGNQNEKAEGHTYSPISSLVVGYNGVISENGNWISDPQDNADWSKIHGTGTAAPNLWSNGTTVQLVVNRINDTMSVTVNGKSWGDYSIAGVGNETIYPMVTSWFRAGPQATLSVSSDVPAALATTTDTTGTSGTSVSKPSTTVKPSTSDTIPATGGSSSDKMAFASVNVPRTIKAGTDTFSGFGATPGEEIQLAWRSSVGGKNPWETVYANAEGQFSAAVDVSGAGHWGLLYERVGGVSEALFGAVPK